MVERESAHGPGDSEPVPAASAEAARWTAALVVVALLGSTALLLATRWGPELKPDSAVYLDAALNLAAGEGLTVGTGDPRKPLVSAAPLFPTLLGVLAALGLEPWPAVRGLHALLFGASVLGLGLVLRCGARWPWLPTAGAFVLASSAEALRVYSAALSEPLAIVTGSLGLVLLARHLTRPAPRWLLLAAGVTSLSLLARYGALPYAATGVLGLLLMRRAPLRRRLLEAAAFGVVAVAPLALWLLGVAGGSGRAPRELGWHPMRWSKLEKAWDTGLDWLAVQGPLTGIVAAALVLGLVAALAARRRRGGEPRAELRLPIRLAGLFVGVYCVFLVAAISFADAQLRLTYRILAPVQITLIPLALWLAAVALPRGRRAGSVALALLALLFATSHVDRGVRWVAKTFRQGAGYAGPAWARSPTLARVRALPPDALIYSNGADVIFLLTGRRARSVPKRFDPKKREPVPGFQEDLREMFRDVHRRNARLVWFDRVWWRSYLAREEDLVAALGMEPVARGRDGTVYAAARP